MAEKLKFVGCHAFTVGAANRANNESLEPGYSWYSKNHGGNQRGPYEEGYRAMDDFMNLPEDPFFTYCKGRS